MYLLLVLCFWRRQTNIVHHRPNTRSCNVNTPTSHEDTSWDPISTYPGTAETASWANWVRIQGEISRQLWSMIQGTRWQWGAISRRYYQRMEPAVHKAGYLRNHAKTESEKWEEYICSREVNKINICKCVWALQFYWTWVCLPWEVIRDHYLLWCFWYWRHPSVCSSELLISDSLALVIPHPPPIFPTGKCDFISQSQ